MARRWYILAGLLAFTAGALMLFPARVVYHWFAPPELALAGIQGTVWRGTADHAEIAGVYLRDLTWKTHPLALLTGRATFDIEAQPVSGFLEGRVSASAGGKISISELSASIALSALADALNMPRLDGNANIRLERLDIVDGLPVAAAGTIEVANLLAPMIYSRGSIGGYRAEFFTQGDGVAASLEDTDGIIDIAGSLVVGADRSYQFLGQLAPKPETTEGLRNQMRFLGSPNDRGQYELRLEGQL